MNSTPDSEISEIPDAKWSPTACILCTLNCGLEVQLEDGRLAKIRGDKSHPISRGYQCQKATRLDFYQNDTSRLTSPLRRRPDGGFDEISWDVAIDEVASKLKHLRDTHGGHSLAYYGGGGQGNHLGGAQAATGRPVGGRRVISRVVWVPSAGTLVGVIGTESHYRDEHDCVQD